MARTAPGAAWRSASTCAATQASRAVSSSTAAVSNPAAAASAALKRSPVSVKRASTRGPMTRSAGTRIIAGATPTRTSVKANVLAAAATAMSAAAMRPRPPARACPLTRAITGTGLSTMAVRTSGMRFGAAAPRSDRSAPEQKTVPVPESTMARTSMSPVASRNASSSSPSRREESALRLCGESSVRVRMPSRCSTATRRSVTEAV